MVAKDGEHEKLAGMTPLVRAKAAAALMDDHRQAIAQLAAVRSDPLRELRVQRAPLDIEGGRVAAQVYV